MKIINMIKWGILLAGYSALGVAMVIATAAIV